MHRAMALSASYRDRIWKAFIATTLPLLLFFEALAASGRETVPLLHGIEKCFLSPGIYWLLFGWLLGAFLLLTIAIWRRERIPLISFWHSDGWLCAVILIGAFSCFLAYPGVSINALRFTTGAVWGRTIRLWIVNAGKGRESVSRIYGLLLLLIVMLAVGVLWHPARAHTYEYRGQLRWEGPWQTPNAFGLLMAVGLVLAIGCATVRFRALVFAGGQRRFGPEHWRAMALLAGAGAFGLGLIRSYSRGAWLAAAIGLVFLLKESGLNEGQVDADEEGSIGLPRLTWWREFLARHGKLLLAGVVAGVIIAFWQFRNTEWHPARRAFSVGNANDFSWRNRLDAWEGAAEMFRDRPGLGFGWEIPERAYNALYRPFKLDDPRAINTNDFLLLGLDLGLPALICFLAYVRLSVRGGTFPEPAAAFPEDRLSEDASRLAIVCRAGAWVMLVGMCFDGALGEMASAAVFWTVIELSRSASGNRLKPPIAPAVGWPAFSRKWVVLAAAVLATAIVWAGARDPFHRVSFSVSSPNSGRLAALAVMPAGKGPFPVAVYVPGAGTNFLSCGNTLRTMAELGLAGVTCEFHASDQAGFELEMRNLLQAVSRFNWANSNAIAWMGNDTGAQRMLDLLARDGQCQPAAVACVGMLCPHQLSALTNAASGPRQPPVLSSRFWLAQGDHDDEFTAEDSRRIAAVLRAHGGNVRFAGLQGLTHNLDGNWALLSRISGEFFAAGFGVASPTRVNVRHGLWFYWLPVFCLFLIMAVRFPSRAGRAAAPPGSRSLRLLVLLLIAIACVETTAHWVLPRMRVSSGTIRVARRLLVQSALRPDFDWLVQSNRARDRMIGELVDNVELAGLQQSLLGVSLETSDYRQFILSPWVDDQTGGDLRWRRALWETLYPRIRRVTEVRQAAEIISRSLRERISITSSDSRRTEISEIWARGTADPSGFQRIYVAGLRAVGVPARMNGLGSAEILEGGEWKAAPQPIVLSAFSTKAD